MNRKYFSDYDKRIVNEDLEYFAINDNSRRITQFLEVVKKLMFIYLNIRIVAIGCIYLLNFSSLIMNSNSFYLLGEIKFPSINSDILSKSSSV